MTRAKAGSDSVGGELERVMRTVTWFLVLPLILPLTSVLRSKPLPTRLDTLEIVVWLLTGAAFYLGFRGRPRDPHTWAAAGAFGFFAMVAAARVAASPQLAALAPFAVAVTAVLAGPAAAPPAPSEDEEPLDAAHPLATAALLERHAEQLELQGRARDAQKIRVRIAKIREKHGTPS